MDRSTETVSRNALESGIAARMKAHHPATVAVVIAILGWMLLSAVTVGIGLLLTHVLLHGGVGRWDENVNDWFVTQRSTVLNSITAVGTTIGSTMTVAAVAVVVVAVLAFRRLWQEIGLIVIALTVEVAVFLTATLMVSRPRPTVPRLDPSPPTSSFPSGHLAAAIALDLARDRDLDAREERGRSDSCVDRGGCPADLRRPLPSLPRHASPQRRPCEPSGRDRRDPDRRTGRWGCFGGRCDAAGP
jgi:hypothetical protein